ncbi:MAG: hypothetical protein BYD32DRAFT_110490 [Podila humilis]|nr:MAG: hypothetical protein BYD32DRAFT_110490 [Podila humilis]
MAGQTAIPNVACPNGRCLRDYEAHYLASHRNRWPSLLEIYLCYVSLLDGIYISMLRFMFYFVLFSSLSFSHIILLLVPSLLSTVSQVFFLQFSLYLQCLALSLPPWQRSFLFQSSCFTLSYLPQRGHSVTWACFPSGSSCRPGTFLSTPVDETRILLAKERSSYGRMNRLFAGLSFLQQLISTTTNLSSSQMSSSTVSRLMILCCFYIMHSISRTWGTDCLKSRT